MMQYETTIGLEVHVQARTASKMFCGCANEFAGEPNTRVCPVCLGYPGVMPVINREAVNQTIMAGLMCSCQIADSSKFDRKNYYYPDMPKNYQISQYDLPICRDGGIEIGGIGFSGNPLPDKTIGLTRIHLEEDVAKSMHQGRWSVIDFNRAGVPLLEIVSEPEITTPDEAYAYLTVLKQIMQYAGVSDCDMEKGQMRCDVNISHRPAGEKELGTKIEIKNLNSFRAVHRSLEYEIERQVEILREGGILTQETRRWDDANGVTTLMRRKEEAHDYRYFPEPDLMPLLITDEWRREVSESMPEAPNTRRKRFIQEYGITEYDAQVLTQTKQLADYYEEACAGGGSRKLIANWVITELMSELNQKGLGITEAPVEAAKLGELVKLIDEQTISGKIAKTVFAEMMSSGASPAKIVEEKGLKQVSNADELSVIIEEVIRENPDPAEQYRGGAEKALQFLVGQVMKKTRGKANPQMAVKMLKESLK